MIIQIWLMLEIGSAKGLRENSWGSVGVGAGGGVDVVVLLGFLFFLFFFWLFVFFARELR